MVGTGASAVQAVPLLASEADKVIVFQRTPCWSPRKFDKHYPEWVKATFRYLPFTMTLLRIGLFLRNEMLFHFLIVTDYWFSSWISKVVHKQVRRNVRKVVKNPETASKLTPSYSMGCKRITPSDTYWKAFNRDNVELVTEPIASICPEGIVTTEGVKKVMRRHLPVHCSERICFNIAKGTTDPKESVLTKKTSLGHIKSSYTNLDQTSSSESRLGINFKISTKEQYLD